MKAIFVIMKAALVFFYSDNTLLVRKQSQCILRTSFEQGKEVEVKCGGCPYVALVLRTSGMFFENLTYTYIYIILVNLQNCCLYVINSEFFFHLKVHNIKFIDNTRCTQ